MEQYWICKRCGNVNLYSEISECEVCGSKITLNDIKEIETNALYLKYIDVCIKIYEYIKYNTLVEITTIKCAGQNRKFSNGIIVGNFNKDDYERYSKEEFYCDANSAYLESDFSRSHDMFLESLKNGNIFAIAHLAIMYHRGEGCKQDKRRSFELFKYGAFLGDPLSSAWLAECYRVGCGTSKKNGLSKKIYKNIVYDLEALAKCENYQALFFMGYNLLHGIFVKKDTKEGYEYIVKAKRLGYKRALFKMAWCYHFGIGTYYNDEAAFYILQNNYNELSGYYMYLLACIYSCGVTTSKGIKNYDKNKAFVCYQIAAEKGNVNAMKELAYYYEYGICTEKNYNMAIKWYEKADEKRKATKLSKKI